MIGKPFLTTKNCLIQPLYGFYTKDHIPFRFASGGGRELFFIEEKELDLNELISGPPVKLPLEVTLRGELFYILLTLSFTYL
jgi:transcription initiation factor TFIID subunit 6